MRLRHRIRTSQKPIFCVARPSLFHRQRAIEVLTIQKLLTTGKLQGQLTVGYTTTLEPVKVAMCTSKQGWFSEMSPSANMASCQKCEGRKLRLNDGE